MMLSDRTIIEEIHKGRLVIDPWSQDCLQPASYDVHLGNNFIEYVYDSPIKETIQSDLSDYDSYHIGPNRFVLACLKERIKLPNDICAIVHGKSSLAREGIMVHATAGFVDPGWDGVLTLEIFQLPVYWAGKVLKVGMPIAQVSFYRMDCEVARPYGHKDLKSKYQNSATVAVSANSITFNGN